MRTVYLSVLLAILMATMAFGAAPVIDDLNKTALDPAWQIHCADNSRVSPTGDGVVLRSRLNDFCYIGRSIDKDLVTVSARILPSRPVGATWATSIFLFWNDGNWCKLGLADFTGTIGRFYVEEAVQGEPRSSHIARIDTNRPYYLRIQLGKDCIRYFCSESGKRWMLLRVIERPGSFSGAPEMIAIGKGHGLGKAPYDKPGLANNYSSPGPIVTSKVSHFSIEDTPAASQVMSKSERMALLEHGPDPIAKIVFADDADPTYEQIAKYYPEMQFPRESVGVPELAGEISIDHLGRLENNYDEPQIAWWSLGEGKPVFGDDLAIERRLLEGWLPVLQLTTVRDDVSYEQTVFGWSESMSADKPLFAYIRLRIRPMNASKSKVPQTVFLETPDPVLRMGFEAKPDRYGAEVFVRMPWPDASKAESIDATEFNEKLRESVGCWRAEIEKAARFEIPEKRVNDAYRAWIGYSRLLVDKVDGIYQPHDGAGFYEKNYGYSVLLHCIALDQYGMHEVAGRYIDSVLHFQQPDGLYTQNYGLSDQGMLLAAIAEHYNLTGDIEWLKRVSDRLILAGNWLIEQRKSAPTSGVTKGLIQFRPYCDYTAPEFNYTGDACCCVGMEKAAAALKSIGMTAEANRLAEEAKKYRADILASMNAAVIRKDGRRLLPIAPDTHRMLKAANYTARDYYSLIGGCLLDTGFLSASDKRAYWVTDLLESSDGLMGGLCRWEADGIDHAYTLGYLLTELQRGNPGKVLMGFYGFLAYGMTRDTYSGVECTSIVTGTNYWTLPHLYSCTQQLRLLRNMILSEDNGSLRIGDAIPRSWLEDGKRLVVRQAPTQFGDVSMKIVSEANSGRITVDFSPPIRLAPKSITLRLRHPGNKAITSVRVDGRLWDKFDRDSVDISGVGRRVRVVVSY
ncbi:MAG: hypothetical protein ACOX3G_00465 [Armatimonadota bacterium]|jgi:hypothetical protein